MIDGDNTQQVQGSQPGNGQGAGVPGGTADDGGEQLIFHHLVRADSALSDFHREGAYAAVCGEVLSTESLPSSVCKCADREEGCCCFEVVVYCQDCLRDAASVNAEWGGAR